MESHTCISGVESESDPKMPSTTWDVYLPTVLDGKMLELKYCKDIL